MLNKRTLLRSATASAIVAVMWKELISDLMAAGLSQQQIAEKVGISQPHVSDLYTGQRGKRIGFELGQKLVALHRKCCRKKDTPTTQSPRRPLTKSGRGAGSSASQTVASELSVDPAMNVERARAAGTKTAIELVAS